jgi:hypothetical protein
MFCSTVAGGRGVALLEGVADVLAPCEDAVEAVGVTIAVVSAGLHPVKSAASRARRLSKTIRRILVTYSW